MKNLEALGRQVATEQDDAIDHHRVIERTASALAWPDEEAPRRRWWAPALLAVAAAVALAVFTLRGERALHIETPGVPVETWVSVTEEQPVAFSDGATVLAARGSRFKVAQLEQHGARVSLERGRLTVSVPHRERTAWVFEAGPFTVNVVGTRFETAWDPTSETFTLSMQDGAVRVVGPGFEKQVVAGQQLERSLKPAVPGAPVVQVEAVEDEPRPAPEVVKPKPVAWKVLAQKRQYPEALQAAQSLGWDSLCATVSAGDLTLLGDVARLGFAPDLAQQAYGQVRSRFPRTRSADTATFFLGRLAFDGGALAEADRWFIRYRAEFPTGTFAAEALGRRLELARRRADADATRTLATDYLAQYPNGPHSRLAKSLLDVP